MIRSARYSMTRRMLQSPIEITISVLASVALWDASSAVAAPTFLGPTPYLSSVDSPFIGATIEDFEDGLLNIAGVTASGGSAAAPGFGCCHDSVDGDDGSIDGSGSLGGTFYSNDEFSVTFTFDATVLGSLPTGAGVVWTDVGFGGGYSSPVTFAAFGPGGVFLGSIDAGILGDGGALGGTAEDRFFGVVDPDGISAIRLSTDNGDWELDHVQDAYVPEPTTLALIGLGFAIIGYRRRQCATGLVSVLLAEKQEERRV